MKSKWGKEGTEIMKNSHKYISKETHQHSNSVIVNVIKANQIKMKENIIEV